MNMVKGQMYVCHQRVLGFGYR